MPDPQDDLLLAIILPFLTPFFLLTAGDLDRAEQAALGTLQRTQASTGADLLTIAQFFAFGFASLNTLGRGMEEGLDSLLMLKLNSSATALTRCQLRNLRIVDAPRARKPAANSAVRPAHTPDPTPAATQASPEPETPEDAAAIEADSEKQIRIARNLQSVARKLTDNPANPGVKADELVEAERQTAEVTERPVASKLRISKDPNDLTWAYTYACTAEECVNDPAGFAHGSQKEANYKARLLNSCSYDALCGNAPDLSELPGFPSKGFAGGRKSAIVDAPMDKRSGRRTQA